MTDDRHVAGNGASVLLRAVGSVAEQRAHRACARIAGLTESSRDARPFGDVSDRRLQATSDPLGKLAGWNIPRLAVGPALHHPQGRRGDPHIRMESTPADHCHDRFCELLGGAPRPRPEVAEPVGFGIVALGDHEGAT